MRHVLVKLALIGFLCRALVPAGFMPAPIADGGPIRFCHGGAAGALLTALLSQRSSLAEEHAHAGDHGHGQHEDDHRDHVKHEAWDRCPVGTAFAFAALTADFSLPLLSLEHDFEPVVAGPPVAGVVLAHYRARAPPLV